MAHKSKEDIEDLRNLLEAIEIACLIRNNCTLTYSQDKTMVELKGFFFDEENIAFLENWINGRK